MTLMASRCRQMNLDAKETLGDIKSICEIFIGFQKYLYEDEVMNNYEDLRMVAEPNLKYK